MWFNNFLIYQLNFLPQFFSNIIFYKLIDKIDQAKNRNYAIITKIKLTVKLILCKVEIFFTLKIFYTL